MGEVESRHIADSVQLFGIAPEVTKWVDLGSGGGFPGLVIAVLAAELRPEMSVVMVESDTRKCVFLRTALRELGVEGQVMQSRIEALSPLDADLVSARALAPLPKLLGYAKRHMAIDAMALFPKGSNWQSELSEARKSWHFDLETHTSVVDPSSVILEVRELSNA
ncbi:ribosomal RNA small subunit methyltransferase G [Allosediminivita pacifica]|nr:ribosomal RNA small subunit methyltransferase G [Allosediminivita pacifica]